MFVGSCAWDCDCQHQSNNTGHTLLAPMQIFGQISFSPFDLRSRRSHTANPSPRPKRSPADINNFPSFDSVRDASLYDNVTRRPLASGSGLGVCCRQCFCTSWNPELVARQQWAQCLMRKDYIFQPLAPTASGGLPSDGYHGNFGAKLCLPT